MPAADRGHDYDQISGSLRRRRAAIPVVRAAAPGSTDVTDFPAGPAALRLQPGWPCSAAGGKIQVWLEPKRHFPAESALNCSVDVRQLYWTVVGTKVRC